MIPGDKTRSAVLKPGWIGPLIPYKSVQQSDSSDDVFDIVKLVKRLALNIEHYREEYAGVALADPDEHTTLIFDSVAQILEYEGITTPDGGVLAIRTQIMAIGLEKGWNLAVSDIIQESKVRYPLGFCKPVKIIWETFMITTVIIKETSIVSEVT